MERTDDRIEDEELEIPEDAQYMGLDETGLPYWHVDGVGFVGEAW